MAGLYEFWRDRTLPDDHPLAWWVTCTVITTEAETAPLARWRPAEGPALAGRHPPPDAADADAGPLGRLAGPGPHRRRGAAGLLAPPPEGLMRAYPVSTAVSNVRNNGPELLKELDGPEEGTLF